MKEKLPTTEGTPERETKKRLEAALFHSIKSLTKIGIDSVLSELPPEKKEECGERFTELLKFLEETRIENLASLSGQLPKSEEK